MLRLPEVDGCRFTASDELALELASWFVDEARHHRGSAGLEDLSLRAVVTIGIELAMWRPGSRPPGSS